MSDSQLTDNQKATLHDLAVLAYEREIKDHLDHLSHDFDKWKEKLISASELNDRIYKYSMSHARAVYSKYSDLDDDLTVFMALKDGILKETEVPKKILELVQNLSLPQFPGL